jgi:hypothetical protein
MSQNMAKEIPMTKVYQIVVEEDMRRILHPADSRHAKRDAVSGWQDRPQEPVGCRAAEAILQQRGGRCLGSQACENHVGHAGTRHRVRGGSLTNRSGAEEEIKEYPADDCEQDGLMENEFGLTQTRAW